MKKGRFFTKIFFLMFSLTFFLTFPAFNKDLLTKVEALQDGDYTYTDNGDSTATITNYTGSDTAIVIPDTVGGLTVTIIGELAFYEKSLTSITIPNSVTSLELGAFADNSLTSITIPNSVISLGIGAFARNSLTSVTIPDSVLSIGGEAFESNFLTSITISTSVKSIGFEAFEDNLLTSVTIPSSVISIEVYAFASNDLTSFELPVQPLGYTAVTWTDGSTQYSPGDTVTDLTKEYNTTGSETIIEYDITYNLDGGSNHGSNPATYNIETATITLLDPTKTGYTFGGWYSEAEFNTEIAEITIGSTEDVTLHAQWATTEYDITYNLDGGSNHGSNPATYNIETATITLLDPTKTGYTFGGWYSEAEFTNEITEITVGSTDNVTLYAKWTINGYTVTFNGNTNTGGSVPTAITQNYNTEVTVLGNTGSLTKTGYTFDGWNTEAGGGGTPYIADDTFNMPAGNTTLYAQWVTVTYNITYNLDSGSNHGSNPATYNIETATITLEDPTKTGYTFGGWYFEAEFTNEVIEITIGSTGNVALYAQWELIVVPEETPPPVDTTPTVEEEEEEEETPEEVVIVEEITEEEIAEVIEILEELEDEGEEINQEEEVTITVGELEIDTKGTKVIHVYQDSDLEIAIPLDTLVGEDSDIDNVYAVLAGDVIKLTLNPVGDQYIGTLTSRNLTGEQSIDILTMFKDSSTKKSVLNISIDPYGYIYTMNKDGNQVRIKDATVSLYKVINGKRTLYTISGQDNPQKTDAEGQYSFMVEPGIYVLVVEAKGYKYYDSEEFEVEKTIVEMNIELEEKFNIFDYWLYIVTGLIVISMTIVLIRKKD